MLIMIAFAVLSSIGGAVMIGVNYFGHQNLLDLTRVRREEVFGAKTAEEIAPKAKKCPTMTYLFITGVFLVISWAVYIGLVIMVYVSEEGEEGGGK
jgi:hypothetical protein